MKILKAIGSALFLCVLAIAYALIIVIGVALLALGDLIAFLARRFTARLRGERLRLGSFPVAYEMPCLVMDADGFVEPPQPLLTSQSLPASQPLRQLCGCALKSGSRLNIVEFPASPIAHERLSTRRGAQAFRQSGAGDNVIVLAQRRRPGTLIILAHHRPGNKH